ncbi:MAG: tripartite tricarboxylate transporter substrate binding protein [Beijerinckiaceae bacterium]|nr:tripartite tricarboxylate transporter substrate binding protein [Beijerinckiaceae bacterium]
MGFRKALMALAALALGAAPSLAQPAPWPTRTVTVVVPYPAGGNTDTMARLAAEFFRKKFGQSFIVDNRPAAGGAVAAAQIAQGGDDGHTIFFAAAVQMIILPMVQKVNYDPAADFKPVSVFGTGPFVLGVHKAVPANNFEEFIAFAKSKRDHINVATAGQGGFSHLAAALLAKRAGMQVVFVPHRGGAPAVQSLAAGDVHAYFGNASEIIQQLEGGNVKALAVSTVRPVDQLPGAPPVAKFFPGFEMSSWNGFFVSSKVSDQTVNLLAGAVADAARDPTISSRLKAFGIEPIGNSPAQFGEIIKGERGIYKEAIEAAGLPILP